MSDRTGFFVGPSIYEHQRPTEVYPVPAQHYYTNNNNNNVVSNNNSSSLSSTTTNLPIVVESRGISGTAQQLYAQSSAKSALCVDGEQNKTNDTSRFLFSSIEAAEREIAALREANEDIHSQLKLEKKLRHDADAKIEYLEDERAALRVPTEHLRSKIARLEAEVERNQQNVADAATMKNEASKALADRSKLEGQLESAKNDAKQLEQEVASLRRTLQQSADDLKKLEQIKTELAKLQQQNQELIKKNGDLEKHVAADDSKARLVSLQKELDSSKEINAAFDQEIKSLKEAASSVSKDVENLTKKNATLEQDNKKIEAEKQALLAAAVSNTNNSTNNNQVATPIKTNNNNVNNNSEIETQQKLIAAENSQLKQNLADSQKTVTELRQKIATVEKENENINKKNLQNTNNNNANNNNITNATQNNTTAPTTSFDHDQQQRLHDQIAERDRRIHVIQASKDQAESLLKSRIESVKDIEATRDRLATALRENEDKLLGANAHIEKLQKSLADVREERDMLVNGGKGLESAASLQAALNHWDHELKLKKLQQDSKNASNKNNNNNINGNQIANNNNNNGEQVNNSNYEKMTPDQLRATVDDRDNMIGVLLKERQEASAAVRAAQDKQRAAENKLIVDNNAQGIRDELNKIRQVNENLQNEINRYQERDTHRVRTIDTLQQQLKDEQQQQQQQQQKPKETANDNIAQNADENNQQQQQHQQHVQSLQAQVDALQQQLKEQQQQHQQPTEVKNAQSAVENNQRQIQSLQAQVDTLQQQLKDHQQRQNEVANNNNTNKNAADNQQIQMLQNQVLFLQGELASSQTRNSKERIAVEASQQSNNSNNNNAANNNNNTNKQDLEKLEQQYKQLQEQHQASIKKFQDELNGQKQKENDLAKQLEVAHTKNQEIVMEHVQSAANSENASVIRALQNQIVALQLQLTSEQGRAGKERQEFSYRIRELEEEIENLKKNSNKTNNNNIKNNNNLNNENNNNNASNNNLNAMTNNKNISVEKDNEINRLKEIIEEKQTDIRHLENDVEELTSRLDDVREELQTTRNTEAALQLLGTNSNNNNNNIISPTRASRKTRKHTSEVDLMTQRTLEMQARDSHKHYSNVDRLTLMTELEKLNEQLNTEKRARTRAEKRLSDLEKQASTAQMEARERHNEMMIQKQLVENMKQQASQSGNEKELLEVLRVEVADRETALVHVSLELAAAKKRANSADGEVHELRKKMAELNANNMRALADAQRQVDASVQALKNETAARASAETVAAKFKDEVAELATIRQELKTLTAQSKKADGVENQIEKLKATIAELTEKLASAQKLNAEHARARDAPADKIRGLENELSALQKKLASTEEMNEELASQSRAARQVAEQNTVRAAKADTEVAKAQAQFVKAQNEIQILQGNAETVKILKQEVADRDARLKNMNNNSDNAANADSATVKVLAKITKQNEELVRQAEILSKKVKDLSDAASRDAELQKLLRGDTQDRENALVQMKQRVDAAEKHAVEISNLNQQLQHQVRSQTQQQVSVADVQDMKNQVANLTTELRAARQSAEQNAVRANQESAATVKIQQQLAQVSSKLEQAEQQVASQKSETKDSVQLQKKNDELNRQMEILAKKVKDLSETASRDAELQKLLRGDNQDRENALVEMKKRVDAAESKFVELTNSNQQFQHQVRSLQKNEAAVADVQDMKNQVANLTNELRAARQSAEQNAVRANQESNSAAKIQQQLSQVSSKLEQAEQQVASQKSETRETTQLQKKNDELVRQAEILSKKVKDLTDAASRDAELQKLLRGDTQDRESALVQMKQRVDAAEKHAVEVSSLNQQLQHELRSQAQKEQRQRQQQQSAAANANSTATAETVSAVNSNNKKTSQENESLKKENETLRNQNSVLATRLSTTQKTVAENARTRDSVGETLRQTETLEKNNKELAEENAELQSRIRASRDVAEQNAIRCSKSEEACAKQLATINKHVEEIADLKNEVTRIRSSASANLAAVEDAAKTQKKLDISAAENEDLKNKIQDLKDASARDSTLKKILQSDATDREETLVQLQKRLVKAEDFVVQEASRVQQLEARNADLAKKVQQLTNIITGLEDDLGEAENARQSEVQNAEDAAEKLADALANPTVIRQTIHERIRGGGPRRTEADALNAIAVGLFDRDHTHREQHLRDMHHEDVVAYERKRKENAEKRCKDMKAKLDEISGEYESNKAELEKLRTLVNTDADLRKNYDESVRQVEILSKKVKDLTDAASRDAELQKLLRGDTQDRENALVQMKQRVDAAEKHAVEISNLNQQLQHQVRSQTQQQVSVADVQDMQNQVANLTTELRAARQSAEQNAVRAIQESNSAAKIQQQLSQVSSKLEQAEQQVKKQQNEASVIIPSAAATKKIESLQDENAELQSKLRASRQVAEQNAIRASQELAESRKFQIQLDQANAKIVALQKEIEELKQKLQTVPVLQSEIQDRESTLTSLNGVNSQNAQMRQSAESEVAALRARLVQLEQSSARILALEKQLAAADAESKKRAIVFAELKESSVTAKKSADAKIVDVESQMKDFERRANDALKAAQTVAKSDFEEKMKECNELKAKLNDKSALVTAEKKSSDLESLVAQRDKEIRALEGKINRLEEQCRDLQETVQKDAQYQKLLAGDVSDREEAATLLKARLTKAETFVVAEKNYKEDIIMNLRLEIEDLKTQINKLESDSKKSEQVVAQQKNQESASAKIVENLKKNEQELVAKLASAQQLIVAGKEVGNALKETETRLDANQKIVDDLNKKLNDTNSKLEKTQQQLDAQIKQTEADQKIIQTLNSSLVDRENAISGAVKQVAELKNEISSLASRLEASRTIAETNGTNLAKSRVENTNIARDLEKTKNDLEKMTKRFNDAIASQQKSDSELHEARRQVSEKDSSDLRFAALQQRSQDQEKQVAEAVNRKKTAEGLVSGLRAEIDKLEKQSVTLEADNIESHQAAELLRARVQSLEAKLKAAADVEAGLTGENKHLAALLKDSAAEREDVAAALCNRAKKAETTLVEEANRALAAEYENKKREERVANYRSRLDDATLRVMDQEDRQREVEELEMSFESKMLTADERLREINHINAARGSSGYLFFPGLVAQGFDQNNAGAIDAALSPTRLGGAAGIRQDELLKLRARTEALEATHTMQITAMHHSQVLRDHRHRDIVSRLRGGGVFASTTANNNNNNNNSRATAVPASAPLPRATIANNNNNNNLLMSPTGPNRPSVYLNANNNNAGPSQIRAPIRRDRNLMSQDEE